MSEGASANPALRLSSTVRRRLPIPRCQSVMTATFWDQLLAFALGILTNFIVWFILFHLLVPRIRFSPMISRVDTAKTAYDKSGFRYRFRIENTGWRNIVDVELTARLSFRGEKTGTWNTLYIPLNATGELAWRIPILYPAKRGIARRRPIMFLHPNSSHELLHWTAVPAHIRKKAHAKKVTLEDLLSLGSSAKLRVQAYCYDSFSGARKVYVSHEYTLASVAPRPFKHTSVEIEEPTAGSSEPPSFQEHTLSPPNNSLERTQPQREDRRK